MDIYGSLMDIYDKTMLYAPASPRCTSHAVGVQLGLGEQPFSLTLYYRCCNLP